MSPLWRCRRGGDELRPEYDFSSMEGGARGKYFERVRSGLRPRPASRHEVHPKSLSASERGLLVSVEAGEWHSWSDEHQAFVAEAPALSGCVALGSSYEEALSRVLKAVAGGGDPAGPGGLP